MSQYRQPVNVSNSAYRDHWIAGALTSASSGLPTEKSLLDVGAGISPYRQVAEGLGFKYRSHDFLAYEPDAGVPGLQDATWRYPKHDLVCDILEIPASETADVILCTEVLEHVPDPVRAFEVMARVLRPGGFMIVTVPFISLMHQAPYWFQSGLSPFWFSYWAERNRLDVVDLVAQGDYADLMAQEVGRLLQLPPRFRGASRLGSAVVRRRRSAMGRDLAQSGAFGTLFLGQKAADGSSLNSGR